jgi:hypothetical protein
MAPRMVNNDSLTPPLPYGISAPHTVVIRYLITARPYASRQLHTARARPTLVRDGLDVHFCAV